MDAPILDAVRTPFGRHRGGLSHIRTDDLAALPIAELTKRLPGLDPARVDDVMLGASQPRVVVDLCRELRRRGGGLGVAAACIGVGQGLAIVCEV
jgi:acetyl-CoA acetyltransferase